MEGNQADTRHVEEAISEVRDVPRHVWAEISDHALTERMVHLAQGLKRDEEIGNAESAHDAAKHLAAMAIEYMARGLA